MAAPANTSRARNARRKRLGKRKTHPSATNANIKQRRKERNQKVVMEFLAPGCIVCGITDLRVLNCAHKIAKEKLHNISNLVSRGMGINLLMVELEKCEPMCLNHHAIKDNLNNLPKLAIIKEVEA